jgi:hypothetical protein
MLDHRAARLRLHRGYLQKQISAMQIGGAGRLRAQLKKNILAAAPLSPGFFADRH